MILAPHLIIPKPKILMPQRRVEWLGPSTEHGIRRFWRLTGRFHDGLIRNRWWFEDREEADAFLLTLGPGLIYELANITTITGTNAANQTFNVPGDWNNSSNQIEIIAGGGGSGAGSVGASGGRGGGGGGGGSYASGTNIVLTLRGTATYRLDNAPATTVTAGDSWFNGATLAGSSVGAKGGTGGASGVGDANSGATGVGGLAASCIGGAGGGTLNPGAPFAYNGGNGGPLTVDGLGNNGGCPGGGAAGPFGAGAAGGGRGSNTGGSGGGADGGSAGSAGASTTGGNNRLGTGGGAAGTTGAGGDGSNGGGGGSPADLRNGASCRGGLGGIELIVAWASLVGPAGGAGGSSYPGGAGGNAAGRVGTNYGGGASGGAGDVTTAGVGAAGSQGVIVLTNDVMHGWDAEIPEVRARLWPSQLVGY